MGQALWDGGCVQARGQRGTGYSEFWEIWRGANIRLWLLLQIPVLLDIWWFREISMINEVYRGVDLEYGNLRTAHLCARNFKSVHLMEVNKFWCWCILVSLQAGSQAPNPPRSRRKVSRCFASLFLTTMCSVEASEMYAESLSTSASKYNQWSTLLLLEIVLQLNISSCFNCMSITLCWH